MEIRSADEKGKAKSPAPEYDKSAQPPETAKAAPPAQPTDAAGLAARERLSRPQRNEPTRKDASRDEAWRAAVQLAELMRLSRVREDVPGAQQVAPPIRPTVAAGPAARERLARPQSDARARKDASRARQGSPPAMSREEAWRVAAEMAERVRLSRSQKNAPGAQQAAPPARPTGAAVPAARERLSRPQEEEPARKDAPPAMSREEAWRVAAQMAERVRLSRSQKNAPGAQQVTPPARPIEAADPATRQILSQFEEQLSQLQAQLSRLDGDAPGTQQAVPPLQTRDPAEPVARSQLSGIQGQLAQLQDELSRLQKDANVPSDAPVQKGVPVATQTPLQRDAPGARQAAPHVRPPDAAEMALREKLSQLRKAPPRSQEDALGAPPRETHPGSAAYSWTKARIAAAQEIWGKGMVAPGGADMIMSMVEPLGLERKMTVLDLGAGLGGPARIMAKRFGVRVTGVEWDPGLVKDAKALSRSWFWRAKNVSIHSLGKTAERISLSSFDRFIAEDRLLTFPDKARFLRMIGVVLKDHGELLFTDFVLTAPEQRTPAIEAWIAAEPETPIPWSVMDYIKLLSGLGLNMRIENMTEQIWSAIQQSWVAFDARVERTGLDPAHSAALESEASLWTRRVQLLESGELSFYRFHVARRL